MRRRLRSALLVCASGASVWGVVPVAAADAVISSDARAAETNHTGKPVRSSYWQGLVHPERARAEQLVRHGRALLYPALGLGLLFGSEVALQRRIAVESALSRFAQAVELAPDLCEARLFYGKALAFWEQRDDDGLVRSRADEAVQQLLALRALDPLYEAQEVSFQLGVLHTRQGDLAAAVREYERSLSLDSDGENNGTLLGNLAEVTMLRGDLPRALALYERAARESEDGGRVLSLWGVAVVLDRLGEHKSALEQARRAAQQDRAPLAVLRQAGVFFVPGYERSYYEALGALALADGVREPGEQLSTLAARGASWLSNPESLSTLLPFERALAELRNTPEGPMLAPLQQRITRAERELSRAASHPRPSSEASTQKVGEPLPRAREAVCLLWLLRSLSGFVSYLQQDGGSGPFADDAREHIVALRQALGRP